MCATNARDGIESSPGTTALMFPQRSTSEEMPADSSIREISRATLRSWYETVGCWHSDSRMSIASMHENHKPNYTN